MEQLKLEVDRIKINELTKNVVIIGVPIAQNESSMQIVREIFAGLDCDLPDNAVLDVKRVVSQDHSKTRN